MPIYEYECEKCHHQMEALQKISDQPLTDCPACNEPALRKLVSASAFRLKGGGWYETDFKSGGKKNLAGDAKAGDGDKKAGGDAEKKTSSGESSAPAAKPAATGSDS